MLVTILMPCLNEEKSIVHCINKAKLFIQNNNIDGEILVVDNGSTDNSIAYAESLGARVISESSKGYGSALIRGIHEAKGEYIIMGDCDGSYDFYASNIILDKLLEGYDFVCGNRFEGGIKKGAMPFTHKLGVPFLSKVANLKFKTPIRDFHCGLRGFKKSVYDEVVFKSTGFEFATEMIGVLDLDKVKMCEVPITLYNDMRNSKPHLKTVRDGFRHLKCIISM